MCQHSYPGKAGSSSTTPYVSRQVADSPLQKGKLFCRHCSSRVGHQHGLLNWVTTPVRNATTSALCKLTAPLAWHRWTACVSAPQFDSQALGIKGKVLQPECLRQCTPPS